jgi:protein-S-isoprenylcysteine O-methyltransferase Ste14
MRSPPIIAHLGSFVMPLTAAVIVPAVLVERAGWPPSFAETGPLRLAAGTLLIGAGLSMLAWTVSLFVRIGRGTLAPWDPTRRLVVLGPYAHVRNPMISGVLGIIVGEAVALGGWRLATWAIAFFVINHVCCGTRGSDGEAASDDNLVTAPARVVDEPLELLMSGRRHGRGVIRARVRWTVA